MTALTALPSPRIDYQWIASAVNGVQSFFFIAFWAFTALIALK